jgi:protein-disulfide isomerase
MQKMWLIWLGVLAVIAVPAALAAPPAALEITPQDRILGKPDAPITIVEYASMTCPHCARFDMTVLPDLKQKWIETGKAKLILRDYPLDEEALRASMIARCAPPDRFYAFVDTFFSTQDKWVRNKDYKAALTRIAGLGGLSPQEVAACLKDTTLEDEVVKSRQTAQKELGVDSTPTFFVNGEKFTGEQSTEQFDKVLTDISAKS